MDIEDDTNMFDEIQETFECFLKEFNFKKDRFNLMSKLKKVNNLILVKEKKFYFLFNYIFQSIGSCRLP
jgi:hypothetical protein